MFLPEVAKQDAGQPAVRNVEAKVALYVVIFTREP